MILSGLSIQKLLDDKIISISPDPIIKEASVKIHLSNQFSLIRKEYESQESFVLKPKEFVLVLSKETISLPSNYAALYDGYTQLARRGIITHLGSMLVDPGTNGQITLEIFNASDQEQVLEAGMRVGHLMILEVKG